MRRTSSRTVCATPRAIWRRCAARRSRFRSCSDRRRRRSNRWRMSKADATDACIWRSRPGAARLPEFQFIDLRGKRLNDGLSEELIKAVRDCVARGEQALLFRNRRGFSPVLMCHACGWHAACERCDKPMTWHRGAAQMRCHHCGAQRPVPSHCPDCGNLTLEPRGVGTERMEQALTKLFPNVPVIRIDRETTRTRGGVDERLQQLQPDQAGNPRRHADAREGTRSAESHAGRIDRRRRWIVQRRLPRERALVSAHRAGGRPRRTRAEARQSVAADIASRSSAAARPAEIRLRESRQGTARRTPRSVVSSVRISRTSAQRSEDASRR